MRIDEFSAPAGGLSRIDGIRFISVGFDLYAISGCLGVSATIDPDTMIVSGFGDGANATIWRVIRVSDGAVMATGTIADITFSFIGEYNVTYQLQFS